MKGRDYMLKHEESRRIVFIDSVLDTIKNYKEALEENPGMSDYRKDQEKLYAFDEILKTFEWYVGKEGE